MNSTQFEALKNDSNLRPSRRLGNGWTAVEINTGAKTRSGKPIGTGNPILADADVRTAIHWAIDRNTLVANVLGGLGVAGSRLPAAGLPAVGVDAVGRRGDRPTTRPRPTQILDAAGYTKGGDGVRVDPKTGKPLSFRLGIHSDSSRDTQISQLLKGWLQAIGIDLQIESLSMTKLNDNLAKGDWDMLMDGWCTGPDPTYLLGIQTCGTLPLDDGTGGNTDAFYCNPEFDKLFAQQVTTFDATQRRRSSSRCRTSSTRPTPT